jgi:glycosyltransferase involved in cell wall biosynthesis
VIERLPTATIDIVGKNPAPQVIDFANVPGVRLVGAVDDVRPYLADADVAIAPLKIARGIQNKVLEAMAMAKPVVLTSPAAEGIEAIPDKHFVVADTAEDWLENILALERTPEARRQLGAAARELIENEFEWSSRLEPLDALLGFSKRSDRIEQPSPVG